MPGGRVFSKLSRRAAFLLACVIASSLAHAQEPRAGEDGTDYWVQAQGALSILDTRTDTPVQRLSAGVQLGLRPGGRFGVFLNAEMNRSIDFGRVSPDVDFVQVGPGVDYFWRERHLKSSISAGPTFLTKEAGGEPAGRRGWYVDIRPVSIRYPLEGGGVFELTPLSVDISRPADRDEFSMYGNFVIVAYEWDAR